MAGEDGNRMMFGLVALLGIALGVVLHLWFQDRESTDVEFDVDTDGAAVRVEREVAAGSPAVTPSAAGWPPRPSLSPAPTPLG